MRRDVLALGAVLCLMAAVLGTLWGRQAASPPSETEVINRWAADYVAEVGAGAELTDCVATPGRAEGVWLIIRCTPAKEDLGARVYVVAPDGTRLDPAELEGPST